MTHTEETMKQHTYLELDGALRNLRLLLLADGRKVQAGSPIDVYRQPESLVAMELLADPGINQFTP